MTDKMNQPLLQVRDLRVSFHTYAGEVRAVRGVSFDLNRGETLAFVGESGCGKTVTAKAVMRLLPKGFAQIEPGSKVIYDGQDVLAMNKRQLMAYRGEQVGMIFQDPMTSLNPTMTCGKQIMETLLLHRNLSKRQAYGEALEMLRKVKIPDPESRMKNYPHQMSGGMRQRVMIAIALACSPSVLLADEPTTALDVTIQAQILDLLQELQQQMGTAIVMVTHDLGVVANFAHRVQVMYAGQVIERGTVDDIFHNPQHPYTQALLQSVPRPSEGSKRELYALGGTPPDLILPLNHCPFAARCKYRMSICEQSHPDETVLSPTHRANCWLMDPRAPRGFDGQGRCAG